jgi:hypothetical protein
MGVVGDAVYGEDHDLSIAGLIQNADYALLVGAGGAEAGDQEGGVFLRVVSAAATGARELLASLR